MLTDSNRVGTFFPASNSNNIATGTDLIATGSDGQTYWTLFNPEGESNTDSVIITYATLNDMLTDTDRLGAFFPTAGSVGTAIISTGANIMLENEEESELCFPVVSNSNNAVSIICL